MPQTQTILMIFIICYLSSFSRLACLVSASNGFSLKLIHMDSPLSPLYQANLSNFERFKKHVDISESRALYFHLSTKGVQNNSIRIPLKHSQPLFTAELGLGTPVVKTTLIFDTGSHLTWTQCKPCIKCFKQVQPIFNSKTSKSYKSLTKTNKLANTFNCLPIGCLYHILYYSGQYSVGTASTETFTFQNTYQARDLVFGCGFYNKGPLDPTTAVSGILGMNKNPVSFTRQLGNTIKGRFSYCFPSFTSSQKLSYLRFGDEAVIRAKKFQSTPFLKSTTDAHYRLYLTDISLGGQKLGLDKKGTAFPQGCLIDSGASVSLIRGDVYSEMQEWFIKYFARFSVKRVVGGEVPQQFLCFALLNGFTKFPSMTYQFQGADLDVPPENLFLFDEGFFCLATIASRNNITILGAHQQQNKRFVYDLDKETLSFANEDCSRDAE